MRPSYLNKKSISLGLAIVFLIPNNSYAVTPMSYEDSLRITAPADSAQVVGNCPNMLPGWVARENKKSGVGGAKAGTKLKPNIMSATKRYCSIFKD